MPTPDLHELWVTDRYLLLVVFCLVFGGGGGRCGACLTVLYINPPTLRIPSANHMPVLGDTAPRRGQLTPRHGLAEPLALFLGVGSPRSSAGVVVPTSLPPHPLPQPPNPAEPREWSPPSKRCGTGGRAAARLTPSPEPSQKLAAAGRAVPVFQGLRESPLPSRPAKREQDGGERGETPVPTLLSGVGEAISSGAPISSLFSRCWDGTVPRISPQSWLGEDIENKNDK